MADVFDVRLESLTADTQVALRPLAPSAPLEPGNAAPSFYLETFGCQMNDHDSEKVAGVLLGRGYRQVHSPAAASVILYNTCSIREKAAQKVFSRLGEYKDGQDGGKIIGVLGCLAQQEGERIFSRSPWVSLVCGSASYRHLPDMLAELEAGNRRVAGLGKDTDETFETEVTRRDHPFRAYVTIIEGCDKCCAYCVVPYTRGPERSRTSESILHEVRELADAGYSEIQLLGQTVNSYKDSSERKMRFSDLLLRVAEVAGIRRVRFTTSHPADFGPDIVQAIDSTPVLCDHVHLPVQSGSDRILNAMRRTYTRDEYLAKIALIRASRRPIDVTTDIIVGFPGETAADFEDTLSLMDQVQYAGAFSFKYSPRPNTAARDMADPIPEDEKSRRLAILQERQRQIQSRSNEQLIGSTLEVLVERKSRMENQWSGHSTSNRVISFSSPAAGLVGKYVQVRVTLGSPNSLTGVHVL